MEPKVGLIDRVQRHPLGLLVVVGLAIPLCSAVGLATLAVSQGVVFWPAATSSVAVAAALAALEVTLWTYLSSRAEQVYLEYTGRYREALAELPSEFFSKGFSLENVSAGNEMDKVRRAVHRYVDLCSEEVKLRIRRVVLREVWPDWHEGLEYGLNCDAVEAVRATSPWRTDYEVLEAYRKHGLDAARGVYWKQREKYRAQMKAEREERRRHTAP